MHTLAQHMPGAGCPAGPRMGREIWRTQVKGSDQVGLIKRIKEEIAIIRQRDPAIHSSMEVFLYPSFKVMLHYRIAHRLYEKKHYFLARWVSQRGVRKTGIEIHPGAQIGKGFFIDHGNGVIIGETTVIGDNVTLYQGVTLGGTGKEQGKRHPTVGNNVMISAGAKVLGSFKIGDNSKIGAGSVVLEEVPPNSTVVGVPGRVVKRDNRSLPQEELDQVNLPDPIKEEISSLHGANLELTNRLLDLEQEVRKIKRGGNPKPRRNEE
ncbi:serine acetyltransferase [Lachnospiraceae bacterium]|nr:serine acetyltransferase [Lachnospiraceae bacterium]